MKRKQRPTIDYDPNWRPPTGDTLRFVQVQPGEQTCLECGDTFAAGSYCIRCCTSEDGVRRTRRQMPPSVPTAIYLQPEEYETAR